LEDVKILTLSINNMGLICIDRRL